MATLFFAATTSASWARWANFEYRTFDLAYYVQAIWQLIHGRFQVSVEDVPLLGNHVEPIVILFAPVFAVFRHPMLFVVVQNAALAAMAPIGYSIGRRLQLDDRGACLTSLALLLAPAAGYVALHEFHPEALAAPLLLVLFHARLTNARLRYWICFIGVLACKENMALLLCTYCMVDLIARRTSSAGELRAWNIWPFCVSIVWFVLCTRVITPVLNSGSIDYLALYDRLGHSAREIVTNAISHPQLAGGALFHALTHGNLVWALLGPLLFLPLLRPRWLLIGVPVLLQHLLSWRASEWTIYFHYASPLIPLFWMAAVEAVAGTAKSKPVLGKVAPAGILIGCLAAQIWIGPAGTLASASASWFGDRAARADKNAFLAQIPPSASVLAPLPYLSHLAMRQKLYSLHFVLKGLKTLSRSAYTPPSDTEFVLVDYLDSATFDPVSGYYHPAMHTADDRVVPSSDRLLHQFFLGAEWQTTQQNELALFRKTPAAQPPVANGSELTLCAVGPDTTLWLAELTSDMMAVGGRTEVRLGWQFQSDRQIFPWMLLKLTSQNSTMVLTKGLCAPEKTAGRWIERWQITAAALPAGDYTVEALLTDNSKRAWSTMSGQAEPNRFELCPPISLGRLRVGP